MSLDLTPVHRNLHTKVTFLGLEFEDLILVLALAALMNLLAHFVSGNAHVFGIPLNVFMEFVVPALAVPFLILFKYGRPRGYVTDLIWSDRVKFRDAHLGLLLLVKLFEGRAGSGRSSLCDG
jgi:hypothetical protein